MTKDFDKTSKVENPNYFPGEDEMRRKAYEIGGDHSKPLNENISCSEKEANQMAQCSLFDDF